MKKILINPKEIVKVRIYDEALSERFYYTSATTGILWWKKTEYGYYDIRDWRQSGFVTEKEILSENIYKIDDKNKKVIIKSNIQIIDTNGGLIEKHFENHKERNIFVEENFSKLNFIEIIW